MILKFSFFSFFLDLKKSWLQNWNMHLLVPQYIQVRVQHGCKIPYSRIKTHELKKLENCQSCWNRLFSICDFIWKLSMILKEDKKHLFSKKCILYITMFFSVIKISQKDKVFIYLSLKFALMCSSKMANIMYRFVLFRDQES